MRLHRKKDGEKEEEVQIIQLKEYEDKEK